MWKSKTPGIPDDEFERIESVPITKEEVRSIQISKARLSPGQIVLDIGCGTGGSAFFIARHYGCFVRGLDMSPTMIAIANEYR